ncbi:MAG: helix-turn-helix domain-containing protein, partial [Planctomycetaceae bacterium]|nr:helix-turn-helix domain-containing protein [Planctomycetaceae bacterium]
DDQRRMAELYASGRTCRNIADSFGCSRSSVSQTLKKLGVKKRSNGIRIPIEKHPQIIQLYQAGKSCNEITATSKLPAIYLGVFVREKRVATKSRVKKKQPVKKKAKRPPEKPATKQRMLDFRD